MKIARIVYRGRPAYCVAGRESVSLVRGGLFGKLERTGVELPFEGLEFLAPLTPCEVLCTGKNYKEHAAEFKSEVPENPLLFIKARSSVCGMRDDVLIPREVTRECDFEAELAVVIGKDARCVSEEEAPSRVFGYTCANDVSARECQRNDGQWARAKSFDTFCPLGPWIETEIDPSDLAVEGRLNGKVMQKSRTSRLIFSVPRLISYFSRSMTLRRGTVLLTGTPSGCGFARSPRVFLGDGDVYEVAIEGIGTLRSRFREV